MPGRGIVVKFFVAIIGIIFIGALPALFQTSSILGYFETVGSILGAILQIGDLTYNVKGTERMLFPEILKPFAMSLMILCSALFLSVILAIIFTIITMMLPKKVIEKIKFVVFMLESLPDIFVIMMLQVFVIFLYKQTGILFFKIASFGEEQAMGLPILCLSLIPMVQFYKILILIFEDELEEGYVDLAKGKGLKQSAVLLVHVLRNAAISMFYHSKSVIWFMLTSLLILEYLFNIYGITSFLRSYLTPEIFTVGLLLLFLPFFVLYSLGEKMLQKLQQEEGA